MVKILVLIAAIYFFLTSFSSAVYSPIDYFRITYEPAMFSKTEITSEDIFYATIKSRGVAINNPPSPADAVRFSYRYTANNKAIGEELILNPSHSVTVEPFPKKIGETYEALNEVPLRFPAGSKAGDYTVIEEIINIEMKDPGADWQDAPKPSKPLPPVQPSAPVKPSAPTKPSEPTKPSAPIRPSAPTQPSGTGSGETKPSQPSEPTKPPEPTRPPEPTKLSEPTKPSEPTRPSEPTKPPGPRREIGIVKYFPEKPTLVPSPIPELTPTPKTLTPGPASAPVPSTGFCSRSCPSDTIQQGTGNCKPLDNYYRCGWFGRKTCYESITQFYCAPIPPSPPITLTVSPTAVFNGASAVGKVTLSSPAPAGGQVVQLARPGGAPLKLPDRVMINPGETSGTFNILTYRVPTSFNVTIKAKLNNYEGTALLTVNPTAMSALTVSPASVINGASAVGKVTLSSPAPTGGSQIVLSAAPSGSLTFPANVMVKAGETSATFNIVTKTVTSPVNVTVKAMLNNTEKTAQFTINPTPVPLPGFCTTSQTCPSDTIKQGTGNCKPVDSYYRCGFLRSRRCYRSIPQIYCIPISPSQRISL